MTRTPIQSDAHWHELRATTIGGSESAALLGVSKYQTPFELFHRKRGTLPHIDESERMLIGKEIEPGIAGALAKKYDLILRKCADYITHDTIAGMGCTLDYEVLVHFENGEPVKYSELSFDEVRRIVNGEFLRREHVWVPLDIKNIDYAVYKKDWIGEDETSEPEPPLDIAIQMQHQIACTQAQGAFVGMLIGGHTLKLIRCPRHEATINMVAAAVSNFWLNMQNGIEPSVQASDIDAVRKVYREATNMDIVHMDNRHLASLCERYNETIDIAKHAQEEADLLQAEMLQIIGANSYVRCGDYEIKSKTVHKKGYQVSYFVESSAYRQKPTVRKVSAMENVV